MSKALNALMAVENCTALSEETRTSLRTILMEIAKEVPETEQELQDRLWVGAPRELVNNYTTFRTLAHKIQLESFETSRLRDKDIVAYRAIMPVFNKVLGLYNELLRRKDFFTKWFRIHCQETVESVKESSKDINFYSWASSIYSDSENLFHHFMVYSVETIDRWSSSRQELIQEAPKKFPKENIESLLEIHKHFVNYYNRLLEETNEPYKL